MNQKQTPFLIEQYAIWYSRYDWIFHLQKFELFDDWTLKLNTLCTEISFQLYSLILNFLKCQSCIASHL